MAETVTVDRSPSLSLSLDGDPLSPRPSALAQHPDCSRTICRQVIAVALMLLLLI
jgi:hypothetical protein